MFASSCAFEASGTVPNETLCGPWLTLTNLIPSPTLMVSLPGSKRYPFSSPIIFTTTVLPVMGSGDAALVAAGAGVPGVATDAELAGAGVLAAGAAAAVSAVLSPPAHAASEIVPAASTTNETRILENPRIGHDDRRCWLSRASRADRSNYRPAIWR